MNHPLATPSHGDDMDRLVIQLRERGRLPPVDDLVPYIGDANAVRPLNRLHPDLIFVDPERDGPDLPAQVRRLILSAAAFIGVCAMVVGAAGWVLERVGVPT